MNSLKNKLLFLLARIITLTAPAPGYFAFCGAGSARQLCAHIARSGVRRLLVVTDKPLRELGIVDRALQGFEDYPVDIAFYDGVLPDPTFDHVAEGARAMREHGSNAVLAIGGGSSIDAAKIIAASAVSDEDPREWMGFGKIKHELPPIYVIPTTAGTGSEATRGAVISDPVTHEKSVLSGSGVQPAAVALDPELQSGMPAPITAATGMDALTHAIEAYISPWDRGTARENAEQAVRLIFANLRRAVEDGSDRDAREAMCMAAYYAGMAINQVNVGNVHAIAHQLGGKYSIPHGVANAMVLPHILEFCAAEAEQSLAELAVMAGIARDGQGQRERARAFIDAVVELRDAVGIPAASDKVRAEDFDYLTDLAVNEAVGYFAPRLLDRAGTRDVLEKISA
jgi:alcohol dehydrogenase class IV